MSAPAWPEILDRVQATPTGARLQRAAAARLVGQGPAHVDAPLRLFDAASEAEVRVVFYRDTAGWCPYCQKVWLLLEEKRIPFKVVKINMRSYGEKPSWFLQMVPGGLLPAIELDGQMMTDSLPIMQALDEAFPSEPRMVPRVGSAERTRASELLSLERELFSAWCSLTFQPGKGLLDSNERKMLDTMRRVDEALGATPGPFFLGGDTPTLVDLQYVSHVERMVPSLLFWKNLRLRGSKFAHLDRWLSAFEERPAYLATKSDFYTHVMDIPPQYGPGYSVREAAACEAEIIGRSGSWSLPLALDAPAALEPLPASQYVGGAEASRHEAAYELATNAANVARFAARGAGLSAAQAGKKQFQALLADPNAVPADELVEPVDLILRHVAVALLDGRARAEGSRFSSGGADPAALSSCLVYLRDRIGVPRDMGQAAAFELRAHLNWAADGLSSGS